MTGVGEGRVWLSVSNYPWFPFLYRFFCLRFSSPNHPDSGCSDRRPLSHLLLLSHATTFMTTIIRSFLSGTAIEHFPIGARKLKACLTPCWNWLFFLRLRLVSTVDLSWIITYGTNGEGEKGFLTDSLTSCCLVEGKEIWGRNFQLVGCLFCAGWLGFVVVDICAISCHGSMKVEVEVR